MEDLIFNFSTMQQIVLCFFLILLLIQGLSRLIFRKKWEVSLLKLPEQSKSNLVQSYLRIVRLLKILLWPTPFYLLFVPMIIYRYMQEDFLFFSILMVLLSTAAFQGYFFGKWIINRLQTTPVQNQ